MPASTLISVTTFSGNNPLPFNFGRVYGDATFEFILQGVPNSSACLAEACGSQSFLKNFESRGRSSLRYAQNTLQLGFTQDGVRDYTFTPVANQKSDSTQSCLASPTAPTIIAYVWSSATKSMQIFVSGSLAGSCSSVDKSFSMPSGAGYLGSQFVGQIYRMTVYNSMLPPSVLQRHYLAFCGLTASPTVF
jgi:hypothetical protein